MYFLCQKKIMKKSISYNIDHENEADALVFKAKKDEKIYTFFILGSLLFENELQIWVKDESYYDKFINENIESLIKGVETGQYMVRENGSVFINKDNFRP